MHQLLVAGRTVINIFDKVMYILKNKKAALSDG